MLFVEDLDDFFDTDAIFGLEFDDWAGDDADLDWSFEPPREFKFPRLPYAADILYNAVKTKGKMGWKFVTDFLE